MLLQKGQKSDVVSVLVRLEFGDRTIGELAKVECAADQESEVNFSTSLPVSSEDALTIDELASKPLLCMLALLIYLSLAIMPVFQAPMAPPFSRVRR